MHTRKSFLIRLTLAAALALPLASQAQARMTHSLPPNS